MYKKIPQYSRRNCKHEDYVCYYLLNLANDICFWKVLLNAVDACYYVANFCKYMYCYSIYCSGDILKLFNDWSACMVLCLCCNLKQVV